MAEPVLHQRRAEMARDTLARWSCALALAGSLVACQRHEATVDVEVLADLSAACAGPEGTLDCAPARFERTFADRLPALRGQREVVVARWLRALEGGHHDAAYGLAWANERRALPALRRSLLAERSFYGWETSEPYSLATRMSDENYPRQTAYAVAIESLARVPLRNAVALQPLERAALVREAFAPETPGGGSDAARWLLSKLAPDVLEVRASDTAQQARPLPAPPALDGYVIAAHDSDHHDVFPLARAHRGRLKAVQAREGCRVLPGASVLLGTPVRRVKLPKKLFSNELHRCLSEPAGLPAGDAVGVLGMEPRGSSAPLDESRRPPFEALALEALLRETGADPADFVAQLTVTLFTDQERETVVVGARATRRPREVDGQPVPCASPLCEVARPDTPSASLVVVFEADRRAVPLERLRVASRPGGCSERQHDEVALSGVLSLHGLLPLVLVQRRFCDGWQVELYGAGPAGGQLVAVRAGSGI